MKPRLSYTIWFSQRTGSTLLCNALEVTDIAGRPNEWLLASNLLEKYGATDHAELQEHLWNVGSTSNGVWGLKHSFFEPHFAQIVETFREFPTCLAKEATRAMIWEYAFPNHRHIFMTRRNKVRLAVSWWKAIQTQEWHRVHGQAPGIVDLSNAYSFEAINHLYNECTMREAGIQEFFSEGKIIPLTIVYEDFVQGYEQTVRTVLDALELDARSIAIAPPRLAQLADEVSEEWTQRFREERQSEWENRGW